MESPDIAVKSVSIRLTGDGGKARFEVASLEGSPSEVSVQSSGSVYQYLQIDHENLEGDIESVTITFDLPREWLESNRLARIHRRTWGQPLKKLLGAPLNLG